jgi:hypothetical protein
MGFDYAMEQIIIRVLNTLIIENENATRHLDTPLQIAFRYLATKKIEQIKRSSTSNMVDKRHRYKLRQIATILQHSNVTVAKADKRKTVVIISKDALQNKIETFIQTNDMLQLASDPTDLYQKHLLQTIQKCTSILHKAQLKHLSQMKDGFGGLVVSMLGSGSRVRGFKPGRSRWIFNEC